MFTWFAGYRMRFFAEKGLAGDLSDVWANLPDFTEGFKTAATGNDGKQYLVPTSYYPWAVHYRKSVFEDKGYTIPTTKGVPFNSIIGDRGKGGNLNHTKPVSNDGIVPYWSSHLDGAQSELIVPSMMKSP